MGEDEQSGWPDDDADPFADIHHEEQATEAPRDEDLPDEENSNIESLSETVSEEDSKSITEQDTTGTEMPLVETQPVSAAGWTLPVRAAPLLFQFHNEEVSEFPLQQTKDGRESVSLVVDDDLLRIIETRLDPDGQRRMKVCLSMKRDITGFKHHHNQLLHKHQFLWIGTSVWGLFFLFFLSNTFVFSILGTVLTAVGAWNWLKMHFETHTLEFTHPGGSLSYTLRGYGNDRPFLRASMAYIGSEMAQFLRTGELDTEAVLELHANLAAPPPALPPPEPVPVPPPSVEISTPTVPQSVVAAPPPATKPAPPQNIPSPPEPMNDPPVATAPPPPSALPQAPSPPLPLPTPPPPLATPPAPMPHAPPPPVTPLPPAPTPPPPLTSSAMPLPPPLGLPGAPIPLDAPMPNAPEVAVTASPVEEILSEEEQNNLLNELS